MDEAERRAASDRIERVEAGAAAPPAPVRDERDVPAPTRLLSAATGAVFLALAAMVVWPRDESLDVAGAAIGVGLSALGAFFTRAAWRGRSPRWLRAGGWKDALMVPVGLGIAWVGITGLDKLGEIMDAAAGRLGMPGWGFRIALGVAGSLIYLSAVALRTSVRRARKNASAGEESAQTGA